MSWHLRVLGLVSIMICGCSTTTSMSTEVSKEPVPQATYTRQVPGVVEYVWEEPMVDVIEVPPGLDPDGIYYRPAHEEVIEIRQGRWQYYRDALENR